VRLKILGVKIWQNVIFGRIVCVCVCVCMYVCVCGWSCLKMTTVGFGSSRLYLKVSSLVKCKLKYDVQLFISD
jgi:hypothetical protein